jgi:AcrR family transcriptional regulator
VTTTVERTRPLRADAERNRHRILTAAREVFARRGLDAGLDEIARHAGVGTGTVYRRFPDKQHLVEALVADWLDELLRLVEHGAEHPDPWVGLVEVLESLVGSQVQDRGLKDAIFGRLADCDAFREHRGRLTPVLQRVVDRAKAAGVVRDDVEVTDLASIQLMLTQVATFAGARHPDVWRRYLRLLLDGLRAERSSPTPLGRPALTPAEFEAACTHCDAG